ncbi:AmmeMemoRadiSam system protein B [Patescibacteria group bacterium]|nr:AmmeMemoRadiSam system protein B [Patescibacteria group bacterium]MBU4455126.1 AmmeMemoRadiSam system protein B [Patescibacteria group bacterium]
MKKLNAKILISLAILLLIIQAGLFVIFFTRQASPESKVSSENNIIGKIAGLPNFPKHRAYFMNVDFYEEAYGQAETQIKNPGVKVYGGILPHHLIVKDKIAAFLEALKDNNYKTVVLIGPDHFFAGKANITMSAAEWDTPYGMLEPDLDLIGKLNKSSFASIEEWPFAGEHSISGLVGFIKRSFPQVKIVPIIIKLNAAEEECSDLAKAIAVNADKENTLILASVDFSHYQPAAVADFHDLKSNAVISAFDFSRIYDLEIDSPPSVYTVLKYLEAAGAKQSKIIFSTNSGSLTDKPDDPATSHNFFYFKSGAPVKNETINFLFFGDMMLDRNVGAKMKSVAGNDSVKGLEYALGELAGQENRFFQGIDIISCNLEGAVTDNGAHYTPANAYDFAFAPDLIGGLKKYGFNFFSLANNHFSDQGERGIMETRKNLDELDINYAGCKDSIIGDCSGEIIEAANKKIGMAGFSMVYKKFDLSKAEEIIKDLASATDLVIVNIHWGVEYQHQFNKLQQETARKLIDAGADMIIGHHPHVVQGMEIYNGNPIFYSLGNFVFDQYFSADTEEGLAVGINADDKRLEIFLYPLKSKLSQVELMAGEDKKKFLEKFVKWSKANEKYAEQIKEGRLFLSF